MKTLVVLLLVVLMLSGCGASKAHYENEAGMLVEVEGGGSVTIMTGEDTILTVSTPDPMPLYKDIVDQNQDILDAVK